MAFIKHALLFIYVFFSASVSAAELSSTLFLGNDETKLIKLNQDAASVIVANPEHLSVIVDTPRHLVVIPRAQGSTKYTVLDKNGDVLMDRRVVIGGNGENYIKIRRACSNGAEGCAPVTQYYCEQGCHEVHIGDQKASAGGGSSQGNSETALLNNPAATNPNAPPLVATE